MTAKKKVSLTPSHKSMAMSKTGSVHSTASGTMINRDLFSVDKDELLEALEDMVFELDVAGVFDRKWKVFRNLMKGLKDNYNDNPFHNWEHGFSVANMAVLFLSRNPEIAETIGKTYTLAFFIAALGHDLDHPGKDNNFLIETGDKLADVYNRKSVLENHHADTLIKLLREEENNVFFNEDEKEFENIIQFIKELVLATDMTYHPSHMDNLRQVEFLRKTLTHPQERRSLLRAVIHACDLSGQVMTLPLAISWEDRITQEMEEQTRTSEIMGIDVPQHMQNLNDPQKRAHLQLGFIDEVLLPLWGEIGRIFEQMKPFHEHLNGIIRNHYHILHTEGEEEASKYDAQVWGVEALSFHVEK